MVLGGWLRDQPRTGKEPPMPQIKATALLQKVLEVASKNPDFVYQDEFPGRPCKYEIDKKPACLIGRGLHEMGMDLGEITKLEERRGEGGMSVLGLFDEMPHLLEEDDPDAVFLMCEMQIHQDSGKPWAEAAGIED